MTGKMHPFASMFELTKGGWKFAGLDNVNE